MKLFSNFYKSKLQTITLDITIVCDNLWMYMLESPMMWIKIYHNLIKHVVTESNIKKAFWVRQDWNNYHFFLNRMRLLNCFEIYDDEKHILWCWNK